MNPDIVPLKKKRGRPEGGRNAPGHNAGRKKKQIANQSSLDGFMQPTSSSLISENIVTHDAGIQTDPLTSEQLDYFLNLKSDVNYKSNCSTSAEISEMNIFDDSAIEIGEDFTETSIHNMEVDEVFREENRSAIEIDRYIEDAAIDTQAIDSNEVGEEAHFVEEAETRELNENEFLQVDVDIGSVPIGSVVDSYLAKIQERLRGGKMPEEYTQSNFWVHPNASFFTLGNIEKDPLQLCIPRVFLWFPHHLQKDLKCPYCHSAIEVKGFNTDPRARRIIDFYEYICKKCKQSFNGYNEQFMNQIDLTLQSHFPAVLTHRSGLSKELVKFMRPAFQHGIGPYRFAKMLRIMHTERYDELQLQYYIALERQRRRPNIASLFHTNTCPEFPKFSDKNTYNGFSPSSNYLSYVYSSVIAKFRPYMDQLMSMLDGIILKGDHSFKVIDHMAKMNGVSTFSCVYTLLNEYEEIRMMVLSHSKKLGNLAPQFIEMIETYRRLGMPEPELFYTDNVIGDEEKLKEFIPSLCKNVKEVPPKHGRSTSLGEQDQLHLLPKVSLPQDLNLRIFSTSSDINNACQIILDAAINNEVHLGFDCEWVTASPVSLIQICHEKTVYLFRVHSFNSSSFPERLADVIKSEKIVKIGKNIQGDFTRLNRHFGVDIPKSKGKVELGAYCFSKGAIPRSNLRLDQICGSILKLYLPKTPAIRCGNWEASSLSAEQKTYAALDAWIALEIYETVKNLPTVNQAVNDMTPYNTFVSVFSKTSRRQMPSAYGYVVDPCNLPSVDIEVVKRKKMNVVKVIDVRIPGMLMDCYTDVDETFTLESFGAVPFFALISNHCLKTSSEVIYLKNNPSMTNDSSCSATSHTDNDVTASSNDDTNGSRSGVNGSANNNPSNDSSNTENSGIPSRILKDAFHIMQMINVPLKHGMSKDFSRRFRDALFVVDPDDKRKVEEYLTSIGTTWKAKILSDPEYIFKRVKRYIPPADELYPVVSMLFENYGNCKCVKSGKPLFNEDCWKSANAVLEEIRKGHVSDVKDGPPLYTEVGYDKNGLMVYRCARGTSSVEGSVHMNIVRKFASYNAGPRLTDMVLTDYRLYHNINVGSKNRYGKIHKGHYSPWLSQAINTIRMKLGHSPIDEYFCNRVGNAFEYQQTKETFGIVSLPLSIMRELNMQPANDGIESSTSNESNFLLSKLVQISVLPCANIPTIGYSSGEFVYRFLAERQTTKFAVTAVHTEAEIQLYHDFTTKPEKKALIKYTSDSKKPDFTEFAKLWSGCCNGTTIFYKTDRHLESYFNIDQDRKKYGESVQLNGETVQMVTSATQESARFRRPIAALPAPEPQNFTSTPLVDDESLERHKNPPERNTPVLIAPSPFPRNNQAISQQYRLHIVPNFQLSAPSSNCEPHKKAKARKRCALCQISDCNGGNSRLYCKYKCGICQNESCGGKYKISPCENQANN